MNSGSLAGKMALALRGMMRLKLHDVELWTNKQLSQSRTTSKIYEPSPMNPEFIEKDKEA